MKFARAAAFFLVLSLAVVAPAQGKDGVEVAACLVTADAQKRLESASPPDPQALIGLVFLSAAYEAGGLDIPDELGLRFLGVVNAKAMEFEAMPAPARRQALEQGMTACRPLLQRVKADLEAVQRSLMAMLAAQMKAAEELQPPLTAQSNWLQEQLKIKNAYADNDRVKVDSVATNLNFDKNGTTTEVVINVQRLTPALTDDELSAFFCPKPQDAAAYCRLQGPLAPIRIKLTKDADGSEIKGHVLHCLVPDKAMAAQVTQSTPLLSCDSFL
jgi:hypothetical protein